MQIKSLRNLLTHQNRFIALISAARGSHTEIVKLLLDAAEEIYGQDTEDLRRFLTQPNNHGFTTLNNAVRNSHLEVAKLSPQKIKLVLGPQDFYNHLTKSYGGVYPV